MIYRVPCPPSGPPRPKLRRFDPQRAPEPLLSTLLALQAFTMVAMWVAFAGTITARFATTSLEGCGCNPTLACLVR